MKKIFQKIWRFFCHIFGKKKIMVPTKGSITEARLEFCTKNSKLNKLKKQKNDLYNGIRTQEIDAQTLDNNISSLEIEINALSITIHNLRKKQGETLKPYYVEYVISTKDGYVPISKTFMLDNSLIVDTNKNPIDPENEKTMELHNTISLILTADHADAIISSIRSL